MQTGKLNVIALVAFAAICGFAGGPTGTAGQVRGLPETRVSYGRNVKEAFSFCAMKLGEDSLLEAGNADAQFDFSKSAASASFAYDESNLYVSIETKGFETTGEVILNAEGKIVRAPIGGKAGYSISIPWKEFGGIPSGDVYCAFDLAWEGLSRNRLISLSQPVRRLGCHTSFPALTANPVFRVKAHLASSKDWGMVVFGAGSDVMNRVETAEVVDVTRLGAPKLSPNVDGDLADWPQDNFASASFLGDFFKGRYAVKLATSYDDKNLYAAAYFTHPDGKPVNSMPGATGAGYSGGDCLQLRLANDDRKISDSYCAWMASDGPALTVDTRDLAKRNLLQRGGALAFGKWKDGYTMEIAIPWEVIGAKPQDGEEWRMTFQPWWNAASDRFTFLTSLAFERPPAKSVSFTAPRSGAVSLGVFDADGHLIRTLLKSDWRDAGETSEPWDLKDQFGEFVKPGEYTLKGLVTDSVKCEYKYTFGNPGNPAWPTADGHGDWLSDEAPPQGVATDGKIIFVAAPGSEKGFATMAIDADGNRLWGVGEEFLFPRCVSLSYLDGKVYAVYSGPIKDEAAKQRGAKAGAVGRCVIIAYDAKTGKHIDFSAKNVATELGERWEYREAYTNVYELIKDKAFAPENYIGQPRYWSAEVGETDNVIGFAALPGSFVISKFYEDKLEIYDSATLAKKGEIALKAPAGLCRLDNDAVLAISGQSVVKVSVSQSTCRQIIQSGLSAPVALNVDSDGNIYVSDWRGEMQVKKFSAKGDFLGEIGRKGGRPWVGKFDFVGMLMPHGLAVTDDGKLFVAESDMCPKRLSRWDAKTGAFEKHWLGPTPYGGMSLFWVDPEEPGFFHTSGCKFIYDEKTGENEIVTTEFRRLSHDQPFMPNGASCMGTGVKIVRNEHGEFLVMGSRSQTVWMRKTGDIYVPCAAIGGLHSMVTDDGTGLTEWDSDIGRHMYRNRRPPCFKGHAGKRGLGGDNFSWSDLNGDGLIQPEEMRWHETLSRGGTYTEGVQYEFYNGWGAQFAADGTANWAGFAKDFDMIMSLKPARWTEYGPVYDINDAEPIHKEDSHGTSVFSAVYTADDGQLFASGSVGHGFRMAGRVAMTSYRKDGSLAWEFASSMTSESKDFACSSVNGEWNMPEIGRILCTWNWWWNYRPYFFTADGLYVGTFGEETTLGPAALWSESATYYFQTKDGTPYLVNGANQSHHVFEVKGLDGAKRFTGKVNVTADEIAKAETDAKIPVKRELPKPVIAFDGSSVHADGGKWRAFTMSAKIDFDAKVLLVDADVDDPTPMLQNGSDFATLFINGDCVDIMLATDPAAPNDRRAPAKGDIRLLFSELDGKPVAVLFEPVTEPRAEKPRQLMAATIDRISILKDADVKIAKRNNGYRLTATVPLVSSPVLESLLSSNHTSLRGDFGVIFSGPAGGRELRLYYYNKNTFMTSDLTTEATLQPAEWGTVLIPNPANVVTDGSFEEDGMWKFALVPEGSKAEYSDIAYAGKRSLYIETDSHVSVGQTFRLPANSGGKTAKLKVFMRSDGLKDADRSKPDKPGAWAATWVAWKDANEKGICVNWASNRTRDSWEWRCERPRNGEALREGEAIELEIPQGAAYVHIDFKITTRGLDRRARVWIDGVELVVE